MTDDLYCSTDGCGDFENNVSKILVDISQLNKDIDQDRRIDDIEAIHLNTALEAAGALATAAEAYSRATEALDNAIPALSTAIEAKAEKTSTEAHIENTSNPHNVTKAQVGLSNVDNTSDSAKPISTATQNALNNKQDKFSLYEHSITVMVNITATIKFSLTVLNQSPTEFTLQTLYDYLGSGGYDYKQCTGVGWYGDSPLDLTGVRGGHATQFVFNGINRANGGMDANVTLNWMEVEVFITDTVRQIV